MTEYEKMSNDIKSFDWKSLPPGMYEMKGDEIVLLNDASAKADIAADHFMSALRRLDT